MDRQAPTPLPETAATDLEKNTQDALAVEEANGGVAIDPVLEKRVLRKLDWNLITLVSVLYLLAFLDRSNIGKS